MKNANSLDREKTKLQTMPKRFSAQKQLPRKGFSQVQLKAHRSVAEGDCSTSQDGSRSQWSHPLIAGLAGVRNSRVLEVRRLALRSHKVEDSRQYVAGFEGLQWEA